MRRVYTFLLYLMVPAILLRLFWRGWRTRGYWQRWPERFGFVPALAKAPESGVLWLHAVSVGEVQAAVPIVRALRARFPQQRILLTTTTVTGSQQAQASLVGEVVHFYAPYDLPGAVQRFLSRTRPRLVVIMETELWPNMLYLCHRQGIPVILANARLSERSARGYRRVQRLTAETLSKITAIAAQTDKDAKRLIALGADRVRVRVTGNVKFDIKLPASLREEAQVLRRLWGVQRAVWIAASTHEGEDQQILDAFKVIKQVIPHSLLVLVPRHPERFTKVIALCRKRDYTIVLRSEKKACATDTDIFIGDSMGELNLFYAAADVAFVGGSLVPTGGHNLLEPAALGKAVITGPHTFNFEEVTRLLREAGAARQVKDAQGLSEAVTAYLVDANMRHAAGEEGKKIVEQNRGALNNLVKMIVKYLS